MGGAKCEEREARDQRERKACERESASRVEHGGVCKIR